VEIKARSSGSPRELQLGSEAGKQESNTLPHMKGFAALMTYQIILRLTRIDIN
jgi:hypothetical protein